MSLLTLIALKFWWLVLLLIIFCICWYFDIDLGK